MKRGLMSLTVAGILRVSPTTFAAILAGLLIHLVLAVSTGLSPDEAHYALYGSRVDWSYFDHPPLVGWLQAPFVAMGGGDLTMRIVPMLCWLATVALSIALSRRLTSSSAVDPQARERSDRWVVGLLLLSPLLDLLGVVMVPDTLLMPLVPAAMLATWSLRDPAVACDWRRWKTLAFIFAAYVLAKYTGVFVVAGSLLSLWRFHGRSTIRLRGLWLALAGAAIGATPILGWNLANHWASFAYQGGHALGAQNWQAKLALRAILLQLLAFGFMFPIGVTRALRDIARAGAAPPACVVREARDMGLLFGAPVLLTFALLSGRGSSLPHWTVCGWMALIPLAVHGGQRLRRFAAITVSLWQGGLLASICVLVMTGGISSEIGLAAASPAGVRMGGASLNPIADVYGWERAARVGSDLAARHGARGLAVMNWSLASRLAWYARPIPVFVVPPHVDQFTLWFGALRTGDAAVVVDWSQMPLAVPLGPSGFESCRPLAQEGTLRSGRQIAHFTYLMCTGWRSDGLEPAAEIGGFHRPAR